MSEGVKVNSKKPEAKRENRVTKGQKTDQSQSTNSPVDQILYLQRTVGNQAVQRLIKSGTLQAKLKIGQPNDIYEQEADRVAEQVMQMSEPEVQNQLEEEEEENLQTKKIIGQAPEVTPNLESSIKSMKGGGHPLPKSARDFFEPRFGHNFSRVQVHADTKAAELTRLLNARAYTVGRDITFGKGQYEPETVQGKRLLAHELTHVVQQQSQMISRKKSFISTRSPVIFLARSPQSKSEIRKFIKNIKREKIEDLLITYINPDFSLTRRQRRKLIAEIKRRFKKKTDKDLQYYKEKIVEGSKFSSSNFAENLSAIINNILTQRQLSRKILTGEQHLNLVLYDSEAYESRFFRLQANLIASSINAFKIPSPCPKDKSKLALQIGGIGFKNSNILPILKDVHKCIKRRVNEIHIVGHLHDGVVFSRAKKMAKHLSPKIRMVFHGCSVLNYQAGLKNLLKNFGPEAEIYAHSTSGEAGRPYEFHKVTLPEQEAVIKHKLLKKVTIILPKTYIRDWAEMQKSQRLYKLLKRKEETVQKESKKIFIKVLSERLRLLVKKWSRKRLEKALKKTPYDWEKKIIEQEIKLRKLVKSIHKISEVGGRVIDEWLETIKKRFTFGK